MKIPRDISGNQLSKILSRYGYIVTRQKGSHIRLSTQLLGGHHISIPAHDPLKVGTLSSILSDVADHFEVTKEQLIQELFK